MTISSIVRLYRQVVPCQKSTKDVVMESRSSSGPVIIRFASRKEAIDITMKIELKYFLARLLFAHYESKYNLGDAV